MQDACNPNDTEFISGEPVYQEFTLEDTDAPDVRFVGTHLGGHSTRRAHSWQWTELDAYRTAKGAWVIHQRGYRERPGQEATHRFQVHVFSSEEQMVNGLGYKRIYMELWRRIGLRQITLE